MTGIAATEYNDEKSQLNIAISMGFGTMIILYTISMNTMTTEEQTKMPGEEQVTTPETTETEVTEESAKEEEAA